MTIELFEDADLEDCMCAAVARGEFATVAEARADLLASLDEAIDELEAGGGIEIDIVAAELHECYVNWPRAAE